MVTNANLFAQAGTINFKAVQAETMQSKAFTKWLDLSAAPKHDAPSTCCTLVIASVAAIAGVLDRWRVPQLARSEFLLNIPTRVPVRGRIAEGALQRCDCAINGALTPARDAGESIFGSVAKGYPVTWR
jgi:hypothetical protein